MRIPPLKIKIFLESNPLKSRTLVRRLPVSKNLDIWDFTPSRLEYLRPPVNTPTPSTTKNETMLRPMSLIHGLMRISLHYTFVGHWSQSGLVWGWGVCGGSDVYLKKACVRQVALDRWFPLNVKMLTL